MTNSRVRRYLPLCGSRTMGAGAAIDLRFFSRGGEDYGSCFERLVSTQLANKALDRSIASAESRLSYEVLPNGHGITITAQAELDELAKRLTGRRSGFGIFGSDTAQTYAKPGGHLYGRF